MYDHKEHEQSETQDINKGKNKVLVNVCKQTKIYKLPDQRVVKNFCVLCEIHS